MKRKGFSILFALVLVLSFSLVMAVPVAAADGAPLSGYEIVTSPAMVFSDGGWGGWSVPAGKVVLGGGFYSTGPVAVSAPGTPGSVWPHYTYGADEYGWCVRDAQDGNSSYGSYVYAICADEPAGYGVVQSVPLNYGDGGWAGWSVPAGKVVLGGGFWLTGGPAAVSAPGTPGSVWPHYTYGADEYGWCVRDAQDGNSSYGSYVYAICANVGIIIDGCDTGVVDQLLSDGSTISGKIAECAAAASNHGEFVRCVSEFTNELKKEGYLTGKEKGKIVSCAAKADIP
jgi:hypothetical protein